MSVFGADVPITFPQWATDVGDVSHLQRNTWEGEIQIRQKYHYYFSGLVFEEKIDEEDVEAPLTYPVGLNLCKMLCIASSDALFGEWNERVVQWEAHQDESVTPAEEKATVLANAILDANGANTMLWEVDLDRNIYGGGVIRISPDLSGFPWIKWSRIPMTNFFPVWDPDDADVLLEAYVVVPMMADQAKAKYGIEPSQEIVYRVEHWTRQTYTNYVDNNKIDQYSGLNPWGVVPFEFIPRFRTSIWWGDSLVEEVIRPQNELNSILADAGETISYNAFPIRYGINLPNDFSTENFPLGPNAMWDLGKKFTDQLRPEVGILKADNALQSGTLEFIHLLFDYTLHTANIPPLAIGMDSGGGQRSGITVEIRLASLVRAIRRSRAYLARGLQRALRTSAIILRQKQVPGISSRAVEQMLNGSIYPSFAPVLPRDQASVVDEVQKGMSTKVPTVSIETAVKRLGYGAAETNRIKDMLKDETLSELFKAKEPIGAPAKPDARVDANGPDNPA